MAMLDSRIGYSKSVEELEWNGSSRIEEQSNKKGKYNICREFKKNLMTAGQDHIII